MSRYWHLEPDSHASSFSIRVYLTSTSSVESRASAVIVNHPGESRTSSLVRENGLGSPPAETIKRG